MKAVDDVSFAVNHKEIFTLIGPNGAGKTSIFNLISRIYNPTSGRLVFDGKDFTSAPPHRIAKMGIARTFQNIDCSTTRRVLSNLLIGRHCHSTTQPRQEALFLPKVRRAEFEHRHKVEQVIDFLDLEAYRDNYIRPAVWRPQSDRACARAVFGAEADAARRAVVRPERRRDRRHVVLDPRHPHELGITVLMVEHDMSLVSRVSDRVMALNYGRELTTGTPAEVQSHPEVVAAYLGT